MGEETPLSEGGAAGPERDAPTTSEVFASFLSRKLQGDAQTLDELIDRHPAKAAELRRMNASWSGAEARPAGGQDSHPTQASVMDEFASEIIQRLARREKSYGRYKLEGELARGGQGAVVRVWDEDLNRHLAMKVILGHADPARKSPSTPQDSRSLGRFLEEAQVTGQLDHPGIVPVHELGLDPEGRVYFTMKLVRGQDLRRIIDLVHDGQEDWTITRALGALLKVCESMAYAHSKGVMHRDLKPGNVMIGRYGEVFVMDWGLARIVGHEDRKDIRIRPQEMPTAQLHVGRRAPADESAESPLITMDGDIVGTPAYMSPEQAMGDVERMGPQSDVYSVGAMLYHLLTGRVPYVPPGARLNNYVIWGLVQNGPPLPVHELAPDVPVELVAICEKAMARDLGDRYQDMLELANDLRAYLEHRVVKAYQTGAVAELKKWVTRNRSLAWMSAAALVLLIGGLGAVGFVEARGRAAAERERGIALENERLAQESEAEARRQQELARLERSNVLRLSAFQNLDDLRRRADELWPIHPDLVPDYEDWLAEARALMGELDFAIAQRAELRARALPMTAELRRASESTHPRYAELASLRARRDALRHAQDVRDGRAEPRAFEPSEERVDEDARGLSTRAWPLVDPQRAEFGREAEGLALALAARERATDDQDRFRAGHVLAWAYFANGLDELALETAWNTKESAPPGAAATAARRLADLEAAVLEVGDGVVERSLTATEVAIAELEASVGARRLYDFEKDEDRWWHDQLEKLIAGLRSFGDPETGLIDGVSPEHALGIARRLALADELQRGTLTGPEAERRWREASTSIRDRAECPAYGGLVLRPQFGLLPIGRDPASGLWEFVHVLSGAVPERTAQGDLVQDPRTGIVLVLLPGGRFWIGAQNTDPDAPNHDAYARQEEGPVHEADLDPFFMAKYEVTQSQWLRFHGANPSTYDSQGSGKRWLEQGRTSELNPVENVTWTDCDTAARRMGLVLPTEAQWEHAARAGTQASWSSGPERDSLATIANTADLSAIRWGAPWSEMQDWLDDGYAIHAPVGTYRANPFGLHDVHGNVGEWCREMYIPYHPEPLTGGEGEQLHAATFPGRVVRGGGFAQPYHASRAASRPAWDEATRNNWIGVRFARRLER